MGAKKTEKKRKVDSVCRTSGRRKEKKKEKWREDKRVEVSVKIEREVTMDVSKKKSCQGGAAWTFVSLLLPLFFHFV